MRVGVAAHGATGFTTGGGRIEDVLLESAADLFGNNPGADRGAVDAVLVSTNDDSKYLGPILAETAGIRPRAAHSVECLCSSGASALVSAYSYIASGLARAVLVAGAELSSSPGRVLEWDVSRGGLAHPVFWASILTKAYKRRHGVTAEQLAAVPVKNRAQARENPGAASAGLHTAADVLASRGLTDEVRLLDCSRPCTGGAALLLASEDVMASMTDSPVWITGIGQRTVSAGFAGAGSFHRLESAADAAREALLMAGREPGEIGVAEVHDAFSVCEPMALESMGLAAGGRGAALASELHGTGDYRINPRGGLLGAGHPLGATGVAQAAEIVQQLRGTAGRRQVDSPRAGLIHNMSAAGTTSAVLVMEP